MIMEKDVKKKILTTAVHLFYLKGVKETSVRDISNKAGVNVSMISYYFGGKDGLLEEIVLAVAEGFASYIGKFDLEKVDDLLVVFRQFLQYLESNRKEIKILFSEMGKSHDYLLPVKTRINELQLKLAGALFIDKKRGQDKELVRQIRIMTDIILGMIFSDYIFDFSSFQDGVDREEKKLWREERIDMLIRMLQQIAGWDSGQMDFKSIF